MDKNKIVRISSILNPIRAKNSISRHSPFIDNKYRKLIVSVHHKSGTVLLKKLFSHIAIRAGLRIDFREKYDFDESDDILFLNHTTVVQPEISNYRGCHVLRDPRDMIISGYNYHLISDEPWLHRKNPAYGGDTYARYLNGMDKESGINIEAEHFFRTTWRQIIQWNYENPDIIELKYEDMINEPQYHFRKVLEFMGLKAYIVNASLRYLETQSLDRQTTSKHVLSGKPGNWKAHVTPSNVKLMHELFAAGLVKLGYEDSLEW